MIALKNRERILDVREERTGATPLEFREDATTGQVVLRGYAATYEPYDCYGGPDAGGWVEQLRADSFSRTLSANPDVMLLLNHTGAPLARTKSGTMVLRADRRGLLVEATLDASDPDVQALLPKMRRGDLDEMSFAFRVKDQEWNSDYTHRTIKEVSLQKGDVSVVNYGMNPNTQVAIAEGTVGALAGLSGRQLAELRRLDGDLIRRAISNLHRVAGQDERAGYGPDCDEEDKGADCEDEEKYGSDCDNEDDESKYGKKSRSDMEDEDGDKEDDEDEEDDEDAGESPDDERKRVRLDADLAALSANLLSAYGLAQDHPELQRKLKAARAQLDRIRGIDDGPTEVDRHLALLRQECGLPDTALLSEAFEYIKREGTDPATALCLFHSEADG